MVAQRFRNSPRRKPAASTCSTAAATAAAAAFSPCEQDGFRLDALLQGIECPDLGPLSQKKARLLGALGAAAVDGVCAARAPRG